MITRRQNDAGSGNEKNGNSGLLDRLHRRLAEACGDLWDTFVDPREPFFDGDGGPWAPLGGGSGRASAGRRSAANRGPTPRHPRPVPAAGGRQRVRHQRP